MDEMYREFRRAPIEKKLDLIYSFIVHYKMENDGISPTIRQVQAQFDVSSTSVCAYYIQRLVDQGRLYRVRAEANTSGLGVPGGRWELERLPA